ncbi:cortical protein marker for cell polarity-domain-containing protein [Blakeslea trispora]|nr:cortical protein marker for cell polarity-domain-containing protein [Blakeslea trispora]
MLIPNARMLLSLLVVLNPVCLASYVTHPNIDLRSLEQLGISGSYKSISIYRDTEQLTHIPQSTSSVISFSNDTLKLVGSSNVDGTILDSCIVNETLYFAGNFTTLNGQPFNHIAALDLATNKISPLKNGLDGVVYSLYCDTDQLYVGGSFVAPLDNAIQHSDSLSVFGGSVAIWKDNAWHGLPWKGMNGPVYSITKVSNSLYFGGKFDTTADGQSHHAPASQPISIPSTGISAVNTSSKSPTAASILCADASNPNPWLLADGATGTWQASFVHYSVNPVLIRIANSKLANHQTNEFSVRSLSDSTVYELTYVDPEANLTRTCTTDCRLSKSLDMGYQDFRITNISLTAGIAIDIKSWYGVSGGLASVKIFQSEIFAYAVPIEQNNVCASTTNANLPKVVKNGSGWIDTTGANAYSAVTVSSDAVQPSVTFYPNLAESGFYQVLLYSPTCDNCTTVDVSVHTTSDTVAAANTSINQQTFTSATIYSGYFDVSASFQPHVTLSLGKNVSISSTKPANMVAYAVQFIKDTSLGGMTSVLQYNTSSPIATVKEAVPWKILGENLPAQSWVKSLATVDKTLYLGGSFSGTDKSNGTYANFVQYETTASQLKSVPNNGFDGPVNAIACSSTDCFVGGGFNSLADNSMMAFNHVAQYNLQKATWTTLEGGVDGNVDSVALLDKQVLITGNFTHLQSTHNSAPGNALWDRELNKWTLQNASSPFLAGSVSNIYNHGSSSYYLGGISHAQRYQSNGISFISSTSDHHTKLLPMESFSPLDSNTSVVSSGVLFKSNTTTKNSTSTTILGGSFHLSNNIQNVAIYDHGEWSGIQGTDWQGSVNSMAVHNDLLYVGGKFTGQEAKDLAIFNLTNKKAFLNPELVAKDKSATYVSTIRPVPSQEMIVVGGYFDSINNVACTSVCGISTRNHSWTILGAGLTGQVADIQPISNSLLVVSGNLTLNNSPLLIAEYDFEKNTWGPLGTADLPGPSSRIAYDNKTQNLYISGESNSSSFLRVWDGQRFVAPRKELGPGSDIQQLTILPVADTSAQNVLLASGYLNLGEYGNVSAAFFDGSSWIPYLVTSGSTGEASLGSLFYLDQPYFVIVKAIAHHFSRPIVILISIACALAIVFMLAGSAMGLVFVKRKRERKIDPQAHPATYYSKPPRAPEYLLAALKQSTPPEDEDEDDNFAEKRPEEEKDQETFYNILKGISSEHLSDPAFAANGAAAVATSHPNNSSSYSFFYNPEDSPSPNPSYPAIAQIAAPPPAAPAIINRYVPALRPESFTRPYSEIQQEASADSFHHGQPNREMTEVPNQGYGSYNPFRSTTFDASTSGSSEYISPVAAAAAASAASAAAIAGYSPQHDATSPTSAKSKLNDPFQSMPDKNIQIQSCPNQPQTLTYVNLPAPVPSSMTTSVIDMTRQNNQTDSPPVANSVRWTNAPDAASAVSYAVVKPISMVGHSDGSSSLVDPVSGPGANSATNPHVNS